MINGINRSYQQSPTFRKSQQNPHFGNGALFIKNGEKLDELAGCFLKSSHKTEHNKELIDSAVKLTVLKTWNFLGLIKYAKVCVENAEGEYADPEKIIARKIGIHKKNVAVGIVEKALNKLAKKVDKCSRADAIED